MVKGYLLSLLDRSVHGATEYKPTHPPIHTAYFILYFFPRRPPTKLPAPLRASLMGLWATGVKFQMGRLPLSGFFTVKVSLHPSFVMLTPTLAIMLSSAFRIQARGS